MNISTDHWLSGAVRKVIPGGAGMGVRRFLVIHYTEGWGALTSYAHWLGSGTNAHLIIDRDGSIYQCRPFDRTCAHAGASSWVDPKTGVAYHGLNSCSIGIELANCGTLIRDVYPDTAGKGFAGKRIPRMVARHKNGGALKQWEVYPAAQLEALERVSKALVARYRLDDIVGHDDIAPTRKSDPGPAFPMEALRLACGFKGMPGKK